MTADWDRRFLEMATLISSWSKDPGSRVGCVIVRPDKTVASLGFNGFPRRCSDDPALYADRETKLARVVHAEVNAIVNSREPLHDCTLYCSWPGRTSPTCDRCAAVIIQAGIGRVVCPAGDENPRWLESLQRARQMYNEAQVLVHAIEPVMPPAVTYGDGDDHRRPGRIDQGAEAPVERPNRPWPIDQIQLADGLRELENWMQRDQATTVWALPVILERQARAAD